jgi:hypothetical protein
MRKRSPSELYAQDWLRCVRLLKKQIELVTNFAAQAVITLENARLLGELRETTEEVVKLNQQLEQRVAPTGSSAILDDAISDSRIVLTQERHHVLGVCTFGEPGETAQVAEESGPRGESEL